MLIPDFQVTESKNKNEKYSGRVEMSKRVMVVCGCLDFSFHIPFLLNSEILNPEGEDCEVLLHQERHLHVDCGGAMQ